MRAMRLADVCSQQVDLSGDDVVECLAITDEEATHGIEAFALAGDGGFVIAGIDADALPDQGVVFIVAGEKLGKGLIIAMGEHGVQGAGDAGEDIGHIQRFAGEGGKGNHPAAERSGDRRWIDIDVEAEADEICFVKAFAEQAGEFLAFDEQIVWPFELDGRTGEQCGGGVADGETGEQGHMVRGDVIAGGQDEGGGEHAGLRPPGIGAAPAAGGLAAGEDDGGGEELIFFPQRYRVIVGAAQRGKPMEAEGLDGLAEALEVEGGIVHGPASWVEVTARDVPWRNRGSAQNELRGTCGEQEISMQGTSYAHAGCFARRA